MKLHPDLAQLIRNQLSLVDREFLNDEHVRETFLTILERRGEVAPILRAMHEVNFLGKYIPEFGKLTCLVQHEFYHQYAADEHTLVCLEQLDRIWEAKDPPYRSLRAAVSKSGTPRPALSRAAAARRRQSGERTKKATIAEVSAEMAMRAAKRLRLEASAAHTLARCHRKSSAHGQRFATARSRRPGGHPPFCASRSETTETLNLLTLLTFADSQGTSDKLWNGFKDSLLWQLHARATALLAGGTEFVRAEEKQRELLLEEVRELAPKPIAAEEVDAHLPALPARYFQIHTAKEILADLDLVHHFMRQLILEHDRALAPVIAWLDEPDRGYNVVKICTWDRAGLFSKIAGSLSAAGLNILSAQIFTRADGIALDTFFVNDGAHRQSCHPRATRQVCRVARKSFDWRGSGFVRAHRAADHQPPGL